MPAAQAVNSTRADSGIRMLIAGELVLGDGAEIAVVDPATEEVYARIPGASLGQFEAAIAAARDAFDAGVWPGRAPAARAEVVRRFLHLLQARKGELRRLLVQETGCPIASPVIGAQLDSPLSATEQLVDIYLRLPETEDSGQPLEERFNPAGSLVWSVKRWAPVGVVAAISAYNFPLFLSLWKVVPALLVGDTVVLRPSPLTPLSSLFLAELAQEAGLPAGVLNIVAERGHEGGVLLSTDPRIDMVTFTGSSDVGARVMGQSAPTLKRLQLELGGKSAQIFMPDSVDRAIGAAAGVCLAHAGQGCVLGTRIFVPESDKATLLEAMAPALSGVIIGDPQQTSTQMGPVISEAQRARCESYVEAAVKAGATIVAGGRRPEHLSRGYYFEPTILDLPDNRNPSAQDEIFGPIVGVIGYRDLDHAVTMANDTAFGLSGYVFGKDTRKAVEIAKRLRTGTVNVNGGMMSAYVSSGGWKRSGLGRERGLEGLRIYQQLQVLNISHG